MFDSGKCLIKGSGTISAGPCIKLDPNSYWNQTQGIFWYPLGSHLYQYKSLNQNESLNQSDDFRVMAEFELPYT